jgi:hypothetical protein
MIDDVEQQDEAMDVFRVHFHLVANCNLEADGRSMRYRLKSEGQAATWEASAKKIIAAHCLPLVAEVKLWKTDNLVHDVSLINYKRFAMIFLECEMPIPAELLNFKFTQAQAATIEYATAESLQFAQVHRIAVPPSVFREINNPAEFTRQCEAAANHNAHSYWMAKEIHKEDEFADILL